MSDTPSRVLANDVTTSIDTTGQGDGGARHINGGKGALVKQKSMGGSAGDVEPNEVTPRVDTEDLSG